MSNENIHSETRYDDLNGEISVNFNEQVDLNSFASRIAGIDTTKYRPLAVRAYITQEIVVTIYALDIEHSRSYTGPTGKIPVRKFKVDVSSQQLFSMFRQIDFTLIAGDYKVDSFDVIN
jgi:hypothetical protein